MHILKNELSCCLLTFPCLIQLVCIHCHASKMNPFIHMKHHLSDADACIVNYSKTSKLRFSPICRFVAESHVFVPFSRPFFSRIDYNFCTSLLNSILATYTGIFLKTFNINLFFLQRI